jgi:hypothetical protein
VADSLDELLKGFSPEVGVLARRARELGREVLPGATESCEGGDYGLGTTPGYKGLVLVITPQRQGIRLGFADGAELEDPAGLLEGRGRVHRFVRISSLEQLDRPELASLIAAAAQRAR